MPYKPLTEKGKNFMHNVASYYTSTYGNKHMVEGKNKWNLPYSTLADTSIIFTSTITYFDLGLSYGVVNNTQLIEKLIEWYDKYAKIYNIDANILSAQTFVESRYLTWNYSQTGALGITQFTPATIYEFIIKNRGSEIEYFTDEEIAKITKNIVEPTLSTSYDMSKGTPETRERARNNRAVLHQNVIDNPEIMIKAQFRLMEWISGRNKTNAASALFAYNRGSGYKVDFYKKYGENYYGLIKYVKNKEGDNYLKEGIDYVERIFAYLGDKDNSIITNNNKKELFTKGKYFGYDIDFSYNRFTD